MDCPVNAKGGGWDIFIVSVTDSFSYTNFSFLVIKQEEILPPFNQMKVIMT